MDTQKDFSNINDTGRKFVKDSYFPAIATFIQKEILKEKPNLRHLAIMSYAAKVIGYDYTLAQ